MHGGDIYRNRVKLDFSVSINPLGVPPGMKEALWRAADLCESYPDPQASRLKKAVGGFLAVPEESLLFGNGASELFMAVTHALMPKKTVLPAPSFYGYEYAVRAAGSEILYFETKREDGFCLTKEITQLLTDDVDLLFLANPNNPTGRLTDREILYGLLRHCRKKGIYVVLDESFIGFCRMGDSLAGEAARWEHLLLVGSFTKLFAIPGVRLGYLVCGNRELLARTARQLPEWNLSCFAQAAGEACAGQAGYLEETQRCVDRERRFLSEGLSGQGFAVFPSDANFLLFYSGYPLYGSLLKKGILIRDCGNFRGLGQGYYRAAVKCRRDNEMLLRELEEMDFGRDCIDTAPGNRETQF